MAVSLQVSLTVLDFDVVDNVIHIMIDNVKLLV